MRAGVSCRAPSPMNLARRWPPSFAQSSRRQRTLKSPATAIEDRHRPERARATLRRSRPASRVWPRSTPAPRPGLPAEERITKRVADVGANGSARDSARCPAGAAVGLGVCRRRSSASRGCAIGCALRHQSNPAGGGVWPKYRRLRASLIALSRSARGRQGIVRRDRGQECCDIVREPHPLGSGGRATLRAPSGPRRAIERGACSGPGSRRRAAAWPHDADDRAHGPCSPWPAPPHRHPTQRELLQDDVIRRGLAAAGLTGDDTTRLGRDSGDAVRTYS